jgi:hypothetical protein
MRPPTLFGPAETISTATISPIRHRLQVHRLSQGDLPSIWPGFLPRRSISTSVRRPRLASLKACCW